MINKLICCFLLITSCTNIKDEPKSNTLTLSEPQTNSIFCDTITINSNTFRVLQDTLNNSFKILKLTANNWQDNLDEAWTSLYEFKDWNKDNYTDIVLRYHHAYTVILYNPQKNEFVKFGDIGELTDEVKHIKGTNLMFNFTERKSWHSELFDIDPNYHKRSYGLMVNYDENSHENNTSYSVVCVYKRLLIYNEAYNNNPDTSILGTNKRLIDKINNPKIFPDNFDLEDYDSLKISFVVKYWTKNWKKFK